MRAPPVNEEKPPSLLCDDSKYALEKLKSIISAEDYEDLGNHSTEAMGETGLFAVGQVTVMFLFWSVYARPLLCFLFNTLILSISVLGYDEGLDGSLPQS